MLRRCCFLEANPLCMHFQRMRTQAGINAVKTDIIVTVCITVYSSAEEASEAEIQI